MSDSKPPQPKPKDKPLLPAAEPPVWKLEIYDSEGRVIALACKPPGASAVIQGDADDLAHVVFEIAGMRRFFAGPDMLARCLVATYHQQFGGPSWEEVAADPALLTAWRTVAAAITADPALS